tara:strand:- start:226 stop:633 length:408 start_codon:yes stop_codon:yes gene_type:complete
MKTTKNKKTNMRTLIRQIVREEVALAIKEVITELKQPTQPTQPVKKKSFTKNSVLNDVLNETAQGGDWKTLGGKEFTTDRMNELVGGQYGDIMKDTQPNGNLATSMGVNPNDAPDFLTKDYRAVMKAIDKKQGKK